MNFVYIDDFVILSKDSIFIPDLFGSLKRRGPAQDFHFDIILYYAASIIANF